MVARVKYKQSVSMIKSTRSQLAIRYESKIVEANNLGILYKHINSRLTHKTRIAPLLSPRGELVIDDTTEAGLLKAYFVSVDVIDDGFPPPLPDAGLNGAHLNSINVDPYDIEKIINHTDATSSPGPGGFPSILFKTLRHKLSGPLSILFRYIFQSNSLPDAWRTAIV